MKEKTKKRFHLILTIAISVVVGGFLTFILSSRTGMDMMIADKVMESSAPDFMEKISALNPLVSTVYAENSKIDVSKLKLIRTADARIEVKKYDESKQVIDSIVKHSNAYISSENETKYETRTQNRLVIRTPAENFDNLLNSLLEVAERIESKSIEVKDVTEEYIDIEARLESKRQLEQRYLSLLEKAKNVKDILEIESNLNGVREEIESKQGRLNYLQNQIALSTITLTYFKELPIPLTQRAKFAFRMSKGFVEGWNMFLSVIVGVAYLWVFIIIAVAGIFFWRFKKKRKTKE